MNILIIPSSYPSDENPLSGIFYKEQAQALHKEGVNITVLAFNVVFASLRRRLLKRNFKLIELYFLKTLLVWFLVQELGIMLSKLSMMNYYDG
jgi:hypothetical protein